MAKVANFFTKISPVKLRNLKVAALCFLAAATFWVLNALNKDNYTTVVDYPVEIIFDTEEFMAVDKLPSRVKIEINGNGWDLLRKYFKFNETPFLIEINNPSTKNYLLTSEIRRSLSENISPTNLVSMVTDTLKFSIDKVVNRKIKIVIDTTANTLAKNHRIAGKIKIDPATVNVKGPTSILQKLNGEIRVGLREDKINGPFDKIIPIELPEDLKSFLTLEEESVHVQMDVFQMLEGNKRVKLKTANFPKNVNIASGTSHVIMTYLIDERKVKELNEIEFEAIVNFNNRDREDSTVAVKISPRPAFLENIKLEPEILKLKYDR